MRYFLIILILFFIQIVGITQDSIISFKGRGVKISSENEIHIQGKVKFHKELWNETYFIADLDYTFTVDFLEDYYDNFDSLASNRFMKPQLFYKLKTSDTIYSVRRSIYAHPVDYYCTKDGGIINQDHKQHIECHCYDYVNDPITFKSITPSRQTMSCGLSDMSPREINSFFVNINVTSFNKLNKKEIDCLYLVLPYIYNDQYSSCVPIKIKK
jgi:hypothetical protein